MADTFDPYYKWLGIPPREQPPNHYRLLGVAAFEDDGDVIQNAADRQMAHLRTFQSGVHSAHSQRLLNEIAGARVCLLDPRRKASYDETLRSDTRADAAAAAVPVAAVPLQMSPAADGVASVSVDADEFADLTAPQARIGRQLRRRKKASGQVWAAAGTLILLLVAVLLAIVFGRGDDEAVESELPVGAGNPAATDAAASRQPADATSPATNPRPTVAADDSATLTGPVDLLANVDPARDAVQGAWRREAGTLVSPGKLGDRLQLPFRLPDEYTLEIQAKRESGQDGIALGVVVGGKQVVVVLDSWNGTNSGLNLIDGRPEIDNETTFHGRLFETGRTLTAVCSVRKDAVRVAVDGQTIVDWRGDVQRFSLDPGYAIPDKRHLFLAILADSTYRFTKVEVRPYDELPPKSSSAEPPPASTAGPVDLLAAIDPERDAVQGRWRRSGGAIFSPPDTEFARLAASHEVPDSYTVQVQVERLPGNVGSRSLVLGLVADGRQFALVIDHDGSTSGLHAIDGLPFNGDNPTVRYGQRLKAAARATILCTVRPGRVLALIDGQTVADWRGQPDQLSLASVWNTPNPQLFLGTNGPFRFTRWELTPQAAAGSKVTDGPPAGNPPARPSQRTGTLADLLRPKKKSQTPSAAALKMAETQVKDQFKDDFDRAKTPAEQTTLARKLADEAAKAAEGSAAQYALFALSAEIAADAGQFTQANDALDMLYERFDADVLSLKDAALTVAAGPRYVKIPSDHRAVAESWVMLVNEAIAQDQYGAAERFARRAVAFARQSTDKIFLALVVEGNKKVEQAAAAYAEARVAREALERNSDDPEKGRIWGRFCCLVKNDWEQGLPFLAHAAQDELSSLAARDLERPTTATDQLALADAWWDAAEREPQTLAKRMLHLRAVHWYNLVLPKLTDLAKSRPRQRVDASDLTRSVIPLDEWVDVLGMVDPARHTAAGEWGRRGTEIGAVRRARFGRFLLPVAPEASYDLEVRFTIAEGGGAEVDVVLPVGDRACTLVLGGWSGQASGLHTIDNVQARDNATAVKPSGIVANNSYKLEVHVEVAGDDAAVKVQLNGRDYLAWQGKRSSLTVTRDFALARPGALGLGAYETMAVFHVARLRLRSGTARVLLD